MRKGPKSKVPASAPPAAADTKKKGKVARKWEEDGPGKIDYSEKGGQQEVLTSLCCVLRSSSRANVVVVLAASTV
jgi:hypothetical protein